MTGYTRSKNKVNNSGDAPSPCFTPRFARNSNHLPDISSKQIPLESTYIFLMIRTRSAGKFSPATSTSHNLARFTLSYALSKSMKHNLIYLLVLMLCYSRVYRISAYSTVLWYSLNPACVGACNFLAFASSVRRLFIVAMNSLARGGATAILR